MKSKHSQSEIITTVLIILLVLASIVIVWQVVKNTVQSGSRNIEDSVVCLDAMGELEIDEIDSCYKTIIITGNKEITAKINRGMKNLNINSFVILVTSEGNSERFEVKKGEAAAEVAMESDPSIDLETPEPGDTKTYIITTTFTSDIDYLEIIPIINNKLCSSLEKTNIKVCLT